jgi:hypothetical protein
MRARPIGLRSVRRYWDRGTPFAAVNFLISMLGLAGIGAFMVLQGDFRDRHILEFFAVLALFFISEKVQGFFAARSEDKLWRDMVELTASSIDVRCIGTHAQGMEYCAEQMKHARAFRDTFFRTEEDKINLSHSEATERFCRAILEMVRDRHGSFDCLVSNVNKSMFKRLVAPIRDELIATGTHLRFQVHTVDHGAVPLIGIQILTYPDGPAEVVFGWNYHNHDDGVVFASKDERLVEYFSHYYAAIRAAGQRFNDVLEEPRAA